MRSADEIYSVLSDFLRKVLALLVGHMFINIIKNRVSTAAQGPII